MSRSRPVVGVTCCQKRSGGEDAQMVTNRYAFAAMKWADAAALLVPAAPELMSAKDVASRLDGLMLTGSPSNLEPQRYGEASAPDSGPFDPHRDAMALGLIAAMIDLGRPVFGVCRGFQEINVAFGGTLTRDVQANPAALSHHAAEGASLEAMFAHDHEVVLTPGGALARGLGQDRMRVNSVHYQGVSVLGKDLSVEAVAADGLIEAVSARVNGAQILAVQWHPEWGADDNPQSQGFFAMFGRALRGEPMAMPGAGREMRGMPP